MCHNVDTVAVEASAVPISANGPRTHCAPTSRADCTARGEKVSLFIFFCRLRLLVCPSHDLRHFRFPATQRFPNVCRHDSAHAVFIPRYNGLHATTHDMHMLHRSSISIRKTLDSIR